MSYDLESNEETLSEGPDIAVIENNTDDVAVNSADEARVVTYPTVSVIVTVTADPPGAPSAATSNITAPVPPARQSSGPVPACDELVF